MDAEQFPKLEWHEPTPDLRRRIVRVLVLDLVALLVVLPVGEGCVRLLFPQTARHLYSTTLTGGYPIERNAYGLRDREFPVERPSHEIRGLCLGDSTTFGTGVAGEQTYPKQLERLLNARGQPPSYLIINGGGQGGTVGRAITFLENQGLALDPAIVILGFAPSSISMTVREQPQPVAERGTSLAPATTSRLQRILAGLRSTAMTMHVQLHRTYLYAFIDANIRKQLYGLGILQDRMDKRQGAVFAYAFDVPDVNVGEVESSYTLYVESVGRLKALLDRRGIPLVVLGMPSRFELSDQSCDNERGFRLDRIRIQPLDRIAARCQQLDVPFVDLRPRLRAERAAMLSDQRPFDELYTPLDYTHLNAVGLGIAAEELLRCTDAHGWLAPRTTNR